MTSKHQEVLREQDFPPNDAKIEIPEKLRLEPGITTSVGISDQEFP